jgi:hypothetical protein
MLAVDVEQVVAEFPQLRRRGGTAVDPAAAAPLQIDCAAQQQGIAGLEAALVEPAIQCDIGIELRRHIQPLGPLAHRSCIRPVAQRQLQGVDEDGFARAGLAGQHREAARQVEFKFTHDHEIAQGDASQCQVRSPEKRGGS